MTDFSLNWYKSPEVVVLRSGSEWIVTTMNNNKPLSDYKIKKIIEVFCADITASQATKILGFNHNTLDKYYNLFRKLIFEHQNTEKEKLCGVVEVDESYFGARRIRGLAIKLKRGRGTLKQPVFGIFERNGKVSHKGINCK